MTTRLAPLLLAASACGSTPAADPPDASAPDASAPDAANGDLRVAPMAWVVVDDRSESWERHLERRAGMRAGLASFLAAGPANLSLAASSFPRLTSDHLDCTADAYAQADLPWGASATALDAHFAEAPWTYGSSLGPALAGAGAIARTHAPDVEPAIVLLTDATPFDDEACESSAWEQVAVTAGS
ncbi:MAG TPA: hypothetical protein VM513_34050, partial [Kofleriaceae bacterium]|nr:hypothetical protein [Kofleriaceae bacterium]